MTESGVIIDSGGNQAFPSGYYDEQQVDSIYKTVKQINQSSTIYAYSKNWTKTVDTSSINVSIKDYSNYQNITVSNVFVVSTGATAYYSSSADGNPAYAGTGISWRYNPTTGIVTINSYGSNNGCSITASSGIIYVFE